MTTDAAVRSEPSSSPPAVTRVVSYLRVSTGQQADKPPRQIVRTLLQRVEIVGKNEARVRGSRGNLLKALASATGNRSIMLAGAGGLNWDRVGRAGMDDAYAFSVPM